MDPLTLLARTDKHYLGSGTGILWAPRFPRWVDSPGFWDEGDIYEYALAPLFTVTYLEAGRDGELRPLALRTVSRRWSPAELVVGYRLDAELQGREHRSVLPGGHFLSEWALQNHGDADRYLWLVVWSVQPAADLDLEGVEVRGARARFGRTLFDRRAQRLDVEVSLEAPGPGGTGAAYLSELAPLEPRWELTPFPEKWRSEPVAETHLGGIDTRGVLYLAAARPLQLAGGSRARVTARARVRPRALGGPTLTGPLSPHVKRYAPPPRRTRATRAPESEDPGALSRAEWMAFFDRVPRLRCSDPYIERYWYYRWYGLRLCSHEGGIGHLAYPGVCEGIGYFHVPIAYSAQCHARELRWLPDPARARGTILNFLAHQREHGQLHGRIYLNHLEGTDFYFASWGDAALAVDAVHPDPEFLHAVYRPLARYAEWLDRERDPDDLGLYDVVNHYETGQEYMSRYLAVDSEADRRGWSGGARLQGVDATVYAYRLQSALATIAERLEDADGAVHWRQVAERTGAAILERMWDPETGMFSDLDPASGRRTGVRAAVCFYPYFTDLTGPEHIEGLRRHLLDPGEFWTRFPVPSTSADDPYYSPDAEWKGKRHACPWNGRVWPMTNSHVAEALARVAIEHDDELRPQAAELIRRFLRMMFHDGDPDRPNCYEHYNPETGRPSIYRGFDDYQHSWVNDLIVKYVAGLRPQADGSLVIDPLPFELEALELRGLPYRGHVLDLTLHGPDLQVAVDGTVEAESRIGERVRVLG